MRVIKPYGNTKTGVGDREKIVRKIQPNSFREDASEIEDFATSHPKLVLAQWISLIDKIITKPGKGDAPSLKQLNLREEVGTAAWDIIVAKDLLAAPPKRLKRLEREWWSKIHPYGRETEPTGALDFRGRWFATFSKERLASKVDGTAIAIALYNHLYVNERRIGKDSPARQTGLIYARAASIARNVLKEPEATLALQCPWTKDDIEQFTAEPDLMTFIHQALKKYKGQRQARTRQAIGREMQRHYKQIFAKDDGSVPGAMEAMRSHPGLFALHSAAKDWFKRLLRAPQAYWLKKSPSTTSELIDELAEVWRNRTVANLVRLGKIIHYEVTPRGETDSPGNVMTNWPRSISASPYWLSDGQTRIKQNEAFVRVWRHALSFASRTITNWADPKSEINRDILGAIQREKAVKNLDSEAFDLTAEVLFGRGASLICGPDLEARRAMLKLGLTGLSRLRNAAFHFSGISSFVDALESLGDQADAGALAALHTLFNDDQFALAKRLSDDLTSVDTEFLLSQKQLDQFLANLEESDSSYDGLPKFQKVLTRGQSAYFWRKIDMRLPPPTTYRTTDDASVRCRHLMLKLLYERPFPTWLCGISSALLREMVNQYITRSTNEARRIAGNDKLIARASGRIKILDGDTIFDLFAMLQKANVSEARDQGRKSVETRDLSKYLRDLELDLIAQAFQLFVETRNLDWLFSLDGHKRSEERQSELPKTGPTALPDRPKDWQAVLYFLIHLVPADEINKLSHQISRTSIRKAEHANVAEPLLSVLQLYEHNHDAKFTGLEGSRGREALRVLFSSSIVADSVLDADPAGVFVAKRSARNIREMLRFLPPDNLFKSLASVPIKQHHLERFQTLSTQVEKAQEIRSVLHEKWIKEEKKLSERDQEQYRACLAVISDYRDISKHINMNNHLDAYRLIIAALAKLVDFVGVWERDLYFVSLALIYQLSGDPNDVFLKKHGRYPIETGQIIEALRNLEENEVSHQVLEQVARLFDVSSFSGGQAKIKTRNDLAHFQVLRSDTIELTELINRTCDLLSYDKKRANAVSKSMINLFRGFGLSLQWETEQGQLCNAHIKSEEIVHLGLSDMTEPRVSNEFVSLAKTLI